MARRVNRGTTRIELSFDEPIPESLTLEPGVSVNGERPLVRPGDHHWKICEIKCGGCTNSIAAVLVTDRSVRFVVGQVIREHLSFGVRKRLSRGSVIELGCAGHGNQDLDTDPLIDFIERLERRSPKNLRIYRLPAVS